MIGNYLEMLVNYLGLPLEVIAILIVGIIVLLKGE